MNAPFPAFLACEECFHANSLTLADVMRMEFIETNGTYVAAHEQYENILVRVGVCPHIPGIIVTTTSTPKRV